MTQHKLSSRELARGLVTDRFKSIPINRAYATSLKLLMILQYKITQELNTKRQY